MGRNPRVAFRRGNRGETAHGGRRRVGPDRDHQAIRRRPSPIARSAAAPAGRLTRSIVSAARLEYGCRLDPRRLADFDRALARRDVEGCFAVGRASPGAVPLDRVMRLEVLMSEKDDPRFDPLARVIVVRFINGFDPSPLNIRKLADCLHCLDDRFIGTEAAAGMNRLADQIAAFHGGRRSRAAAARFRFEGRVERLAWHP
jgi:hypothetical protein